VADVGGRQVVGRVRVVGDRAQLAVVDQLADADDDEVNIVEFGEERLTNRLRTVVGRSVRNEHHEVGNVQPVTSRKRKHLSHRHTQVKVKVKVKVGFLYSATYMVDQEQRAFTNWQLIGKSQWCCSANAAIRCPR